MEGTQAAGGLWWGMEKPRAWAQMTIIQTRKSQGPQIVLGGHLEAMALGRASSVPSTWQVAGQFEEGRTAPLTRGRGTRSLMG